VQWTTPLFTTLGFILKFSPPFHILAIKLKKWRWVRNCFKFIRAEHHHCQHHI